MEENTHKLEIKINPIDMYPGLKDKMAEFESIIRLQRCKRTTHTHTRFRNEFTT